MVPGKEYPCLSKHSDTHVLDYLFNHCLVDRRPQPPTMKRFIYKLTPLGEQIAAQVKAL
jgi:DNA-binding HxlR family transcriptional regulator